MNNSQGLTAPSHLLDAFAQLDRGSYRDALERFEGGNAPDAGELAALWSAEILLYLDRLHEARSLAAPLAAALAPHLDEPGPLGECARRRHLVAAEVAYFQGDYGEARSLANAVLAASDRGDDPQHAMRATYDLGRILRREAEYAESLETLLIATHMAQRIDNEFYEGVIAYNRAVCCFELGDSERVAEYTTRARELLSRAEGLRYYGMSENLYGRLLTEMGEFESGIASFDAAERIAGSLRVVSDLLSVANNAALALLSRKRYDEAERRLTQLVDWERSEGHTIAEFYTLCLLSVAQCAQGKFREAHLSARAALTLAELSGDEEDRFEARLLAVRAQALTGDEEALEQLRELAGDADARANDYHQMMAGTFLAHALIAESPIEATAICREVRDMSSLASGHWLTAELERIEYLLAHAPIKVDEEGRLVIDTRASWPTIRAAREATERYIYERAIAATNGNASAAGRLIGESRYQMHHLGRILQGQAPRPSRSKAPDAALKKPKRRRSRIIYS